MTLASPEMCQKAREAILQLEWAHRNKLEAIRRSNVAIFSKRRWVQLYSSLRGEYQRDLLRGLRRWDAKDVPSHKEVQGKNIQLLRLASCTNLLSNLLTREGVAFLHGQSVSFRSMAVQRALTKEAKASLMKEKKAASLKDIQSDVQAVRNMDSDSDMKGFRYYAKMSGTLMIFDGEFPPLREDEMVYNVFVSAHGLLDRCTTEAIHAAWSLVAPFKKLVERKVWIAAPLEWALKADAQKVRKERPPQVISGWILTSPFRADKSCSEGFLGFVDAANLSKFFGGCQSRERLPFHPCQPVAEIGWAPKKSAPAPANPLFADADPC